MTVLNKIWLTLCLGFFTWVSIAVMFGATPGRDSDGWHHWAALIDGQVAEHGAIFTGLGVWMIGAVIASLGLMVQGRGEADGSGGGDGWFGDGCGGDGGD